MGYGLGACIGAQIGQPDKVCINIAGDGCFRMNMNELATASRYNIPIIQVVINNQVLGMVRQWQTLFYGKRYSQTVLKDKVDFCKVAEGLGCTAIRVTKKEEVAPAIEKAIALKAPVLIECMIPEDDKVFPMVPAGAPISEVFDGDDLKGSPDEKDDEKISFGSTFIFAVITDRIFYSGILLQRRLLCKYLDQRCLLYRKNGGGSEFGAFVAYRGSEYCHRGQRGDRVYNLSCGSRLSGRLQ